MTLEKAVSNIRTAPLEIRYNSIKATGEGDWAVATRNGAFVAARTNTGEVKTAKFKVTNAKLSNSTQTSGASFGIYVSVGSPAYSVCIKEVRICKAADYGEDVPNL